MRARGFTTAQLELLVPREWVHPEKDRLRAWYERLGYTIVRSAPFEEIGVHAVTDLATPCMFLVFTKPLARPQMVDSAAARSMVDAPWMPGAARTRGTVLAGHGPLGRVAIRRAGRRQATVGSWNRPI